MGTPKGLSDLSQVDTDLPQPSEGELPIDWSLVPEVLEPKYFPTKPTKRERRKLQKHAPGQWWPEEMRIAAVTAYAATGSLKRASEISRVTYGTIKRWKTEDWWAEMLSRVRQEKDEELDAKFTKIVDKTLDTIEDRLTNGELVYDTKRGTIVKVPVSTRDAVKVAALAVEKRQLLRGAPTSRTEHIKSSEVKDKLQSLAEEFKKFVKARDITKEANKETEDA